MFGILQPVLLLPANIEDRLRPAQLDAVVAHELFHINRRDNLTAALHMLVEAVFWFHPLVWWIGARLVEERERACDEAVIESGNERYAYAEGILNVCKFYLQSPSLCVAGVTGANLRKRIEQIMSGRVAQNLKAGKKALLSLAACSAVTVPILFGMLNAHRLLAQNPSSADRPRFAEATLKPNDSGDRGTRVMVRPGGIGAENITLRHLVSLAFLTKQVQIDGGPDWVTSATFDVSAVSANKKSTQADVVAMLQSLLEDRFKLAVHQETKVLPVYALVSAEGGLKVTEAKKQNLGYGNADKGHRVCHRPPCCRSERL